MGAFVPASYLGLFLLILGTGVGLPVPEDAVVLGGGWLVHTGATRLVPTMAVALAAALLGDVLLYVAGRKLGPRVAGHRLFGRFLTANRMARAQRFFDRWGAGAVLLGRFVMGLRAAIFLTAGTLRMSFARFFAVNLAGALLSVPLLVWLGAWAGEELPRVAAALSRARLLALVAVAAAVATALIARKLLKRR
jgi:membrane protein DedA with SNARE-associated domain